MIDTFYEFPRGATIRIPIDFEATDGETMADVDLIDADLRFAGYKPVEVKEEMPVLLACTIEERAGNAGWFLLIDSEQSDQLSLGYHVVDARLIVNGTVSISNAAGVKIVEPVTRRPA